MKSLLTHLLSIVVVLAGTTGVAFAGDLSPVGEWQTKSGESRYQFSYCGDGTELCAKLTWLRKDARTAENLKYLNKFILKGAEKAAPNKWNGSIRYKGDTIGGSVILLDAQTMKLRGCKLIFCKTQELAKL